LLNWSDRLVPVTRVARKTASWEKEIGYMDFLALWFSRVLKRIKRSSTLPVIKNLSMHLGKFGCS
jgi:hypothetical protein